MVLLKHKPDVLFIEYDPVFWFHVVDRMIVQEKLASPGGIQHPENAELRRFPGSRGSHYRYEIALSNFEAYLAEYVGFGNPGVEKFFDVVEFYHRFGCRSRICVR